MAPVFCKAKKYYIDQKAGEKYETKVVGNGSSYCFCFILMNLFLFSLTKTETGAKTAPRVTKLGYFDGRVPKLSSRVTLATSGAGVVCDVSIFLVTQGFTINIHRTLQRCHTK